MMSGDSNSRRFSESLVLDDSEKGVVITGITDDTIAAKSGLQAGDEIIGATIHLDHLNKKEVLNILKVLEPYDNNIKVLTKKQLSASADLGSLGLDLKDPAKMLNLNKDLSLDASAEAPSVSLDGLNGKLNATQDLGGEIGGPTLNGDLPNLSLNKPLADAGAKLTMPSLGLTGPNINGDLDGTLDAPDVSVTTPKLNTTSASLDIEKPGIKTGKVKYKAPKFTMPHFNLPKLKTPKAGMDVSGDVDLPSVSGNLETPDLNLSAPKLDLQSPDLDLNGPKVDLNGSGINLEAPNADIDSPSSKIKWPHLKWKGPKVKGPDGDLNTDLSAPDLSLTTPTIDGDLCASDVDINIPKADIKSPDLDVQTPNLDIDGTPGKINWPHFKWKKNNLHGPKSDLDLDANLNTSNVESSLPKVEAGLSAPDVDINLPNADLKGPDIDVQTPTLDIDAPSGKVNWPHLKWKKPKLQSPKADLDIDADLNTADLNVSAPKIEGDINVPNAELNLPEADLNGPNVDLQAPDLDIDAPSGKINWPHLKWKKPKLHGPKADMDLNADLSTPDVDLSVPKINGEISTPDVHQNLPIADLDVKAPDAGKVRFPTLKKPKFLLSGPKVKGPDVDLDAEIKAPDLSLSPQASLDGPGVGLNLPKADVDVKAPDAGKIRFPTLKKPKFLISGAKVKGPDVDLEADVKTPDLSLSPQASLDGPDVGFNLPKADVDVKAPDVDTEAKSGKIKWPTLKKPKWSVSGPKVNGPDADLDVDVSAPDLGLTAPNIDGEIDAPGVNLNLPKADLDGPELDINAPDVEGSGITKWFNFKKPKFGTLKGPKGDIDADVKIPDVDLKAPDVDLNAPKIEGSIEVPNHNVAGPDVNLNGPDIDADIDPPDGKLKFPKFKLPKFQGPKVKGPELDADLKAPDIDASLDNVDAPNIDLQASDVTLSAPDIGLDAPDFDIDSPKADLKGPHVDVDGPDVDALAGKFKIPKINLPKFNLSGPKVKGPNIDVDADGVSSDVNLNLLTPNVKAPNLNLSAPTIKGDLSAPDLDLDAGLKTDIDLSAPKTNISLPDLNLSTPNTKGPDVNLNLPKADVNGPSLDLPEAELQVSDLNVTAPDLSLSSPKLDGSLSAPNIDTTLPKAELEAPVTLKVPNMDINLPKADLKGTDAQLKTPNINLDSHLGDFNLPHFKLPKLGLSSPEVEVPSVQPSVEAGIEASKVNIDTPVGDIEGPEAPNVDANIEKSKLPHFKFPKLKSFSGHKKAEVNTSAKLDISPDVKVEAPSVEGRISTPDLSVSIPEVKTSLNTPELDITAEANAEVKGSPKSKLRWPFKWGLKSGSGTDEEGIDVDSETDVSNVEVEVPVFRTHKLPRNSFDGVGEIADILSLSKLDTETKDYVISKGIRLPIVNPTSKAGEKVDVMERLKMAKEKSPSTNISPTEVKTHIDLKLPNPSLDVGTSAAADSSLVRGGTFKVEKPESVLGMVAPEISTSDENDKLSLSLSNMLGLNIKDSDAE